MTSITDAFLAEIEAAQQAGLQRFGLRVAVDVDPGDEPVSLADAYAHLHIDADSSGSAEDAWLGDHIPAAREYCEAYLGRALAPRTIELATNAFPSAHFLLPFGPVKSVESVTYVDENGDEQSFVDSSDAPLFSLDVYVTPARLSPSYGESWPTARNSDNSVKVRYVTGYVSVADSSNEYVLPRLVRAAMLLVLGCLHANRGDGLTSLPLAVTSLLDLVPNRERLGMA
jgi:uncharacterized phiE125 gp8 family phage protein